MSIEQTNTVDFISTDPKDMVVLTIADHLEWDDQNNHILLLQEKLNKYIAFIESGELLEKYSNAQGRKVTIQIVARFAPDKDAEGFLERAEQIIAKAGYLLKVVVKTNVTKLEAPSSRLKERS